MRSTGVEVAGHLRLVGLVEILQAQAVIASATSLNSLPLSCNINILMQSLASFLHESGKGIIAALHC